MLLAFLPPGGHAPDSLERELQSVPELSLGLMSATQGNYTTAQLLLDITQGARVSYSAYTPALPPALSLRLPRGSPGAQIEPWAAVERRARGAPQPLEPGLLAGEIPGGAAYAGVSGEETEDGAVAADRRGRVAAVAIGPASSLPAGIAALQKRERLVVADLPAGAEGVAQLRELTAARSAGELLIVVERAPDRRGNELLWVAVAGLGGGEELTSQTTNQRGLIAAVDLAPTILAHLGLRAPAAVRGLPLRVAGRLDGPYLRALKARLAVIYARRLPALAWLLVAWALLATLSRSPRARARALRIGALAMLWTPVAVLIGAALEPSAAVEYLTLVLACFSLAALSDTLLGWPRALAAPALVAVLALSADALAGTQLFVRSLLGPNPIFGARFYGIGNELKSGLAVLVLSAVAAVLYPAARGARAATAMAIAGVLLAAMEGSARIGAGVGAVILVSAASATASVVALGGALTSRRALALAASPVVGLALLVALDLATAHGSGHFTGSVLHARSAGDLRDIIVRRYGAAYDALKDGAMPAATALALGAAALAVRTREKLLEPIANDRAWQAALAGGLAAGVVGALSEDSGPVLLVVAVFALGCVLGYLWGRPPDGARAEPRR